MVKLKLSLMVLLVMSLTSVASAELLVDDFSNSGDPAFLSVGSGIVKRTNSNSAFFTENVGFQFAGPSMATIKYKVKGGDRFGDLGDFSKGVSFSFTSASINSNFFVALIADNTHLIGGGPKAIESGPLSFQGDLSSYKTLKFSIIGYTPGIATLGGSLTAIPEPTALMLVGMGVSTVAFRRRRRVA